MSDENTIKVDVKVTNKLRNSGFFGARRYFLFMEVEKGTSTDANAPQLVGHKYKMRVSYDTHARFSIGGTATLTLNRTESGNYVVKHYKG